MAGVFFTILWSAMGIYPAAYLHKQLTKKTDQKSKEVWKHLLTIKTNIQGHYNLYYNAYAWY